jgi:hypothetical protein
VRWIAAAVLVLALATPAQAKPVKRAFVLPATADCVGAGALQAQLRPLERGRWVTATITVPPELGYGDSGSGPIKPGETLVFVVDLVAVD